MKIIFERWWKKNTKVFAIVNYKKSWKKSGIKPKIGIHTNSGKRKNGDRCFDLDICIRYTIFMYTNFDLQKGKNDMSTLIDNHTGLVKLRVKQGDKPKQYKPKEKDTKEIQICLNCEKPNCNGNCKTIKENCYGKIW